MAGCQRRRREGSLRSSYQRPPVFVHTCEEVFVHTCEDLVHTASIKGRGRDSKGRGAKKKEGAWGRKEVKRMLGRGGNEKQECCQRDGGGGTAPAVQCLGLRASTAGGAAGSIPARGVKIPHAAGHSQKIKKRERWRREHANEGDGWCRGP